MPRLAPPINLDRQAREELERLARVPSTTQAVAFRARLVLSASQGLSNQELAATFRITPNTAGKWRSRYFLFGVPGIRDFEHPGRPRKYGRDFGDKLHRLLRQPPPDGKERWTVGCLAQKLAVPRSTMHYILATGHFESRRRPARRRPRR